MDLKQNPIYDTSGVFLGYDISFENGRLEVVDGIEEIKNRLIIGLSVYLGEMFTDTTYGTDYHGNVFGRDVDDTVVIDELKSNILKTRGVTGLESFLLTREEGSRTAELVAEVKTSQGNINLVTPIPV